MSYMCVLENTNGKYILAEFSGPVFKTGKYKIDYKASQMFIHFYEKFHKIVQQYRKGE